MSNPPSLTGPDKYAPAGRSRSLRSLTVLGGVLGYLMLLVAAGWVGLTKAGLATVLTTQVDVVSDTTAPSGPWGLMVICTAVGAVLATGSRAWVEGRVDVLQLGAAAWTLICLGGCTCLGTGWEFTGPDSHCVYRSCWPRGYQEALLALPLMATCVLMLVMATLGRSRPWWWRALIPALAFVVLSVVQVAVWDRFVVPILNAPPAL